ncbi:MAG TPA: ABC transporter ATP-binding protein [Humibacter sp.]|nr:ABC transporter ATP-binding protein [Humibacter sp.]
MSASAEDSDSSLVVDVLARRGAFALEVALQAAAGHVLAVLGPNGAGKSTLLDIVVGRLRPERGGVHIGVRVLSDARSGIHIEPEHRRVGLLNQAPSLFPHLTALENVAFGPRAAGASRHDARADATRLLAAVGLLGYEDRRPARLSGGQQQRVALARALAARPDVLLLDEPFSALDVTTAGDMRMLTAETLRDSATTAVIVTHDVVDALSLADDCVVLDAGRVVDGGRIDRVLGMPRSPFVAALAGMNFLAGTFLGGGLLRTDDGRMLRGRESEPLRAGERAFAAFAPSSVGIARDNDGSRVEGESRLDAVVDQWERSVGGVHVRLVGALGADLKPAEFAALGLRRGEPVVLHVPATAVSVYSADGDASATR